MSEGKLCPFCGELNNRDVFDGDGHYTTCDSCGACGPIEEMGLCWGDRAIEKPLHTEIETLKRRLDEIDKIATQPADPLNLSNRLEWLDNGMDAIHSIAAGEIDGGE